MRKYLFCIGLIVNCLISFAQIKEVQVNKFGNSSYPNEPSIAFSRKEPNKVVICANLDNRYFSNNGGKTWEWQRINTTFGMFGDPVLHATRDGDIYLTHLSKTPGAEKALNYKFIDRMVIQRSDDGGKTFNNGAATGSNGDKIQDKPWLSSDEDSKRRGNVYITWTEFDKMSSSRVEDKSRIQFSSSNNRGETWSQAITISDSVGDCMDDDHTLEGATTAVGVDGTIYCVWAGHNKLYFDKSSDGGITWGKDKVIGTQSSGWSMDVPHVYRTNGMPFLLSDNNKGLLYLIYGDTTFGDADIFVMFSDNQGYTWSEPMRVNQDQVGNGKSQFMANAALDPATGDLAIVFYDRRNSNLNVFSDVYLAVSERGESAFKEVRLNSMITPEFGKATFSGDYIDIDFFQGQVAVVWGAKSETAVLYSVVCKIDSLLLEPSKFEKMGPVYFVDNDGLDDILYIRTTETLKLKYNYSYRKLLGLAKITGETKIEIQCPDDGNSTQDYQITLPKAKHYEATVEMNRGDKLVARIVLNQ